MKLHSERKKERKNEVKKKNPPDAPPVLRAGHCGRNRIMSGFCLWLERWRFRFGLWSRSCDQR